MARSRDVCMVSALAALGAVCRLGVGQLALVLPIPIYGVVIKIGLTETLAFVSGFVFGPALGFLTGGLIIVISDLLTIPGPWTPFIAAIIGIMGLGGGAIRRFTRNPSVILLGVSAVLLTLLSEFLQNIWFALFFNTPLVTALVMGISTAIVAITNNVILMTALGPRIIKLIQKATTTSSDQSELR